MTILSPPHPAPSEIISVPKSALHAKKPSLPSPATRRTTLRMVRHCTHGLQEGKDYTFGPTGMSLWSWASDHCGGCLCTSLLKAVECSLLTRFTLFRAIGGIKRGRNPHQNNSHHQIFSPTAALREPSATVFNKNKTPFMQQSPPLVWTTP